MVHIVEAKTQTLEFFKKCQTQIVTHALGDDLPPIPLQARQSTAQSTGDDNHHGGGEQGRTGAGGMGMTVDDELEGLLCCFPK